MNGDYQEIRQEILDSLRDSKELLLSYTRQLLAEAEEGVGKNRFREVLNRYIEKCIKK